MDPEINLPKYILRAIGSSIAKSGEYAGLSSEQWRDLAVHIYADETVPHPRASGTFLRRGNLSSSGRGRKATLDTLLWDATVNHSGVASKIPHYREVGTVFNRLNPDVRIDPAFYDYDRKTA